jgi:hypothetical protein
MTLVIGGSRAALLAVARDSCGVAPCMRSFVVPEGRRMRSVRPACIIEPSSRALETGMSSSQDSNWKTRLVEGGFPDRRFDVEFWQAQGDEAIFAAAWEMVELAEEVRYGRKPTFQRTATTLKRL